MKRFATILIIVSMLLPVAAIAQRGKKTTKKAKTEAAAREADPRMQMMLEATQRVVFIDSIVVDKDDFISHIPLSAECGKLAQADGLGVYTNELADKRYEAIPDAEKQTHIYTRDLINNSWGEAALLEGLPADEANYPYVMPDGTTLYFAQKGENAIGGYDIFVTRFNNATGTYLRPENVGMPFSSEANDYFYAIDEQLQLGYFVTDRRQPEGKVCIYVFIPNDTRRTYDSAAYTDEQLRRLADIWCIADTWTNGEDRAEALKRLEEARRDFAGRQKRQTASNKPMTELEQLKQKGEALGKALQLARNNYARSNDAQRRKMSAEILQNERDLEAMQLRIRQMEKEERNRQYQP